MIVVEGGKARVRGAQLSETLMTALKANKAEVVAEIERRQMVDRDRYGKVPPPDAPRVAAEVTLTDATKDLVQQHVFRQGRPLHAWVQTRGQRYFEAGASAAMADAMACVDALAWQQGTADGQAAVKWLSELPNDGELLATTTNTDNLNRS